MANEIKIELLQEKDIPELLTFYNRLYKENRTVEKFRWEFFTAPAGNAIYVVAKDGENGKMVGTQCAIPIYLTNVKGERILSAKSEDTLVDPEYRGKSIFENMYQLLFEECRKAGIQCLWGFTSAKKPFERLGFKLPYSHSQSLLVHRVFPAYGYLSSLNAKNTMQSKMKIYGLTWMSRFRSLRRKSPMKGGHLEKFIAVTETRPNLFKTKPVNNFTSENYFSLLQDKAYLDWRITNNPYHEVVFRVAFTSGNDTIGEIIFNHHKNGTWYLLCDQYQQDVPEDVRSAMFASAVDHLIAKNNNVALIRCWDFMHNRYAEVETSRREASGFVHLDRGVYLVWKPLGDNLPDPKEFILSRLASQGMV